ncbi:hypothetical protein Patl1_36508 [Pistacia atlantica]|nr:hypothetical protein Patl1_36508 [Pistacia atlantica]
MPLDSDVFQVPPGSSAPQQVHITQGDHEGSAVIVSWVTPAKPGSKEVVYWRENSKENQTATGVVLTYKFYNYTSGYIHHCNISNLEGETSRKFWFTTPPKVGLDVPYTFGLIGDLDLSYADKYPLHNNNRWDTWGRFVERNLAYQPWIWSAGNHDIDFAPEIGEPIPFKPYTNRYYVSYKASGSTSPLRYPIKRGSAYIIVLSAYSAASIYTPQNMWLKQELPKVNRSKTPWLIERVSNIAYNITNGDCTPVRDESAPVYIIIGDGGNQEGLATNMTEPQPDYSAYREASYGHGIFDIKNRTHGYFSWHRNQDGYAVEADQKWFFNRYCNQVDDY